MLASMARTIIVVALVLTACAEGTTPSPQAESPTPEATVAPTEGSPSPTPPEDVECVDATATGRPEVTIRLHDDEFVPSCLTVLGGHVFFCEYHRAQGMEGQITVTEAG